MTSPDLVQSPEPLPLLIAALPSRVTLEIIKADGALCKTVLQGFTVRPASLAQAPVRQRLEREMARFPDLANLLFTTWKELYADLLADLDNADFIPDGNSLAPLLKTYGENVLRYALLHAEREDVRAWADRLKEIPQIAEAVPTPESTAPSSIPVDHTPDPQQIARLHKQLQAIQTEDTHLKHELSELQQKYQFLVTREGDLRKQYEVTEARLDREQRRARKAEETATELRKQLREMQTPSVAPSSELIAAVEDAIAILRRGLEPTGTPAREIIQEVLPPVTASQPRTRRSQAVTAGDPSISLPYGRTKHTYHATQICNAIALNDEDVLNRIRDGLARMAKEPEKERAAVDTLVKAGIPRPLLTGPLHPALVDGSNIAMMSRSARGKLAYLTQIRRAAWEEGYFPVLIVVDASLRHQIDQPDELMEMVERGEIQMATPGTSADVVLIEETARRDATLITNDRMTNWPEAKKLEKRHVEIDRDNVRLAGFHNSARWF